MVRIEAVEQALPPDWRKTIRRQPGLSIVASAALGFYLGRGHGGRLLAALVGLGVSLAVDRAKRALGISAAR